MMEMMWFVPILGLVCIWIYKSWFTSPKLPPGPKGWPVVGNAFQQDPIRPQITWSKWAEMYGEVMTINSFGVPIVLCNSHQSIWEMLVSKSKDFAGRPSMYAAKYVSDGGKDLVSGDFDSHWIYRKKTFITSIKMYGDGLERLDAIMGGIVTELIEDFQTTNQQPFDPKKPIQLALCNTLSLLLLGEKFQQNDQDFLDLLDLDATGGKIFSPSIQYFLVDSFPWLHYIPLPYCRLMDKYAKGFLNEWTPKMIQKRMAHYDEENPGCIMDALLKQEANDMKNHPPDELTRRHVIALCHEYFAAGMVTSTSLMYTMIAILTVMSDIQAKVHTEINEVLGRRRPRIQDKGAMPYFQAVLEEVLRYAVIIIGVPHKATVDSSICGHFIPKNTQVWANVWHLCHDPEVWEDPWTFKPERFLNDDGTFVPPDHHARRNVFVFSAGRRVCAGEQLARNRIFLITTSLLQNFVLKPADQMPQHDPRTFTPGIIMKPEPYKIKAVPRY